MRFIKKHPYFSSLAASLCGGLLYGLARLVLMQFPGSGFRPYTLTYVAAASACVGIFLIYPLILTGLNLFFFLIPGRDTRFVRTEKIFEYITVCLGALYSCLVLIFYDIQFQADWTETLVNAQVHTPIWTESYPTVILLSCVGILGYLALSLIPLSQMPPLCVVFSISAMYLGAAQCVMWIIQILDAQYLILCLFPANCILIAAKTIRAKMLEYNRLKAAGQALPPKEGSPEGNAAAVNTAPTPGRDAPSAKGRFWYRINRLLQNACLWPAAAFLLMWPLLGICIGLLTLFGQRPDALIRAWTQTSDWNLSGQTAPPNIYYDEHYLCTVAAGGHPKVVKPLRSGMRHGHRVIVNRQLCVANAFEQILEERTPGLHRRIRHLYDTCGYPIARKIRSPYMADLVYYLMKPLEYLFLIVLYSCDVRPEDRIAVQYPHSLPPVPSCRRENRRH